MASATTVAATLPAAHADTPYTGSLATVHPVSPITLVDTADGIGAPRRALRNGKILYVPVGGAHGLPAKADSVTVAVLVTSASGSGQVWVGPGKLKAATALAVGKGRRTSATFVSQLSVKHTLYVAYAGTGSVQVRVVIEAYTAGDLTGSSYFPVTPVRVADTSKGVGLPAHLLAKHASAQVQIAGRAGIPASATAVQLSVSTNSAAAAGAIGGRRVRGRHRTRRVVRAVTSRSHGSALSTLVPHRPADRGQRLQRRRRRHGQRRRLLRRWHHRPALPGHGADAACSTPGAASGRPGRHCRPWPEPSGYGPPPSCRPRAKAVAISLITPTPGLSRDVGGGQRRRAVDRAADHQRAAGGHVDRGPAQLVRGVQPAGDRQPRPGTGERPRLLRPAARLPGPAGRAARRPADLERPPGPPDPPGATAPPTSVPPTSTPPTTAPPVVNHPSVAHVDPADNTTKVNPLTTSVVTDLILPNGGVLPSSINASTVSLVSTSSGVQVPAHYGTSGGADTINVSPTARSPPTPPTGSP